MEKGNVLANCCMGGAVDGGVGGVAESASSVSISAALEMGDGAG